MVNPECLQGYEFLNKFISDYKNLESIGFTAPQIKRMLGRLDYVKDFADTPAWLETVKKLPKGHKWSEGTKFHMKTGKKNAAENYVFLSIGDDLYIKGMLDRKLAAADTSRRDEYGVPQIMSIRDKRICLIRNWRRFKSHKAVYALDAAMTPFLIDSFHTFWNDNGGKMGMQEDNDAADMLARMMSGGGEKNEVP